MLSQSAQLVLLDASPLCTFAECCLLTELRTYLRARARITREVERELLRLSKRSKFAGLADHLEPSGAAPAGGKWPKRTSPLPDSLKPDFANLLQMKYAVGEHEWAHAGEIATVLMAEHRRADLLLIDDDWGAGLAKGRGIAVMSTARLAQEMVVAGALSRDDGYRVFDAATPREVGRDRFEAGLRRLVTPS
jgi:hypothetical protein